VGLTVGGGAEAAAAASSLGLGGALRAPEPHEDVRRFFAAADALLATSRAEGGEPTFSILEALACGLPVIATDIPGHRVGDGGPTALRLSAADPDRIAASAAEVLGRTADERAAEATEAHGWVEANRDLGAWARQVAGLYEEAVTAITRERGVERRRRPRVAVGRASIGS
jgi:glycosyltransferase involved in cell wall biosynthesis